MTKITFIQHDGTERPVETREGRSVMQGGGRQSRPWRHGRLRRRLQLRTCHAYVDEAWIEKVPAASEDERDMIEIGCLHAQANSRLTCQIRVTADLDGLVIRLPESQG